MKHLNLTLLLSIISIIGFSQTAGTLTFSYTPTSHSGYSGTKNVLAIWIQKDNGDFVKTRERYVGWNTSDHLPTWAVNSGGSAWSALLPGCDITDATTGATLATFSTRTIQWDGTDVNGNIVPDGVYKISVESTWDHGNSNTTLRSFTFTKGSNYDIQTPTDDANFTNISLEWIASSTPTNIEEATETPQLFIFPNPAQNFVNIEYEKCTNIKIVSMLGKTVLNLNTYSTAKKIKSIDLSSFSNGIYMVIASNGNNTQQQMIVVNK